MSLINKVLKAFKEEDQVVSFSTVDPYKERARWLRIGNPTLTKKINILGYPVGIVEIRGESKSGKTTLSLHAVKNFLQTYKEEGVASIMSTERRDNKKYAMQMGIDVNEVIISQCKSIEMVFNRIQQIVSTTNEIWEKEKRPGKPRFLFVWDSLGASISEQEKSKMKKAAETDDEEEQGKSAMASAARATKRGFRYINTEVYDQDIWLIVINHVYDDIGSFHGGKSSYGGKAIEFMPSLRLHVIRTGFVKFGDHKRGQSCQVEVIKSDFDSDLAKIPFEINLGKGMILSKEDLEFAEERNIIQKNGANGYSFLNGKLSWTSRKGLYDIQDSNNPLYELLVKKIEEVAAKEVLSNWEDNMKDPTKVLKSKSEVKEDEEEE